VLELAVASNSDPGAGRAGDLMRAEGLAGSYGAGLGDIPPAELETAYYAQRRAQPTAELSNH